MTPKHALFALISVLVLVVSVAADPQLQPTRTSHTNGDRLKRGLKPLKPKKLFNARPKRAPPPPTTSPVFQTGFIAFFTDDDFDGPIYCYLGLGKSCTSSVTNSDIAEFSFSSYSGPFSITGSSPVKYLALTSFLGLDEGPGDFGTFGFVTDAGTTNQINDFTIDALSYAITAIFDNGDGTADSPLYFVVASDGTSLYITENVTGYQAYTNPGANQLYAKFVPITV